MVSALILAAAIAQTTEGPKVGPLKSPRLQLVERHIDRIYQLHDGLSRTRTPLRGLEYLDELVSDGLEVFIAQGFGKAPIKVPSNRAADAYLTALEVGTILEERFDGLGYRIQCRDIPRGSLAERVTCDGFDFTETGAAPPPPPPAGRPWLNITYFFKGDAIANVWIQTSLSAVKNFASNTNRALTPRSDPNDWITSKDFPREARRLGIGGRVTVSLNIARDGVPRNCVIDVSSGDESLDQTTCSALMKRARFEAPKSSTGRPAEGRYQRTTNWMGRSNKIEPTSR